MEVKVCVGSSCHLKGSHGVIESFRRVLKKYDVEDSVELKASFCLGRCSEGVTAECDGKILTGFTPENTEEKFREEIYPLLDER